ncbi:hypothetical protein [Absidia glauca]|uniref:Uncharacterized protein n=1 Tax=Absidia glauca TaxID=4829 RepID=A0A168RCM5_ABSGL|nr:hypothetical protein [Absidia glauca]
MDALHVIVLTCSFFPPACSGWGFIEDGFLINKHSGKVIDIRGGPIVEGARIIQYSQKVMADAQNQRWGYNKGYLYVLSDPRFVLDVRGLADGARLVLQHKKYALDPANQNQLWDLVPGGKVRAEREVLFETNFE